MKNMLVEIDKIKQKLITKAKSKGLYENFGQIEVNKLRNKYSSYQYGNEQERNSYKSINEFDSWCMNYTGEKQ